jgi:hypothetical protein
LLRWQLPGELRIALLEGAGWAGRVDGRHPYDDGGAVLDRLPGPAHGSQLGGVKPGSTALIVISGRAFAYWTVIVETAALRAP